MSQDNQFSEQQLFDQLISSLVHSTWVFLGKIKNPVNDALERDLTQASIQIDMLSMLHKRMKGNLTENEEQYISHLIGELKMNYVDEKNKPEEAPETPEEKDEPAEDKKEKGAEKNGEKS